MMPSPQDRGPLVGPERPLGAFLARKFARSIRMNYSKTSSYSNYININNHYHNQCSSNFPAGSTPILGVLPAGTLPSTGIYPRPYLWDPSTGPEGFQASRAALPGRSTTTGRLSRGRPCPRGRTWRCSSTPRPTRRRG